MRSFEAVSVFSSRKCLFFVLVLLLQRCFCDAKIGFGLDDSNGEKNLDFEHEALDSNRFPGWLGEKHRPSVNKDKE